MHVGADREQLGGDRAPAARARGRAERSPRGSCAARRCRRARPPAAGRGRCGRRRRRGRPRSGSRRRSCCRRRASARPGARAPTASALATQLAAATSSGRARASASAHELARGREHQDAARRRRPRPRRARSRRPRAWSGTRRRAPRSSSAPRAPPARRQLGDDVAHDGRQRVPVARRRRTGAGPRARASPSRHTAFVLTPPMSSPITPPSATLPDHASDPGHRSQGRRRRARGTRGSRTLSPAAQPDRRRGRTPSTLARAVRDRFGLDELYVADLDAIAGRPGQPGRRRGAGARGAGDGRCRHRDGRRRSPRSSSWASRGS